MQRARRAERVSPSLHLSMEVCHPAAGHPREVLSSSKAFPCLHPHISTACRRVQGSESSAGHEHGACTAMHSAGLPAGTPLSWPHQHAWMLVGPDLTPGPLPHGASRATNTPFISRTRAEQQRGLRLCPVLWAGPAAGAAASLSSK